MEQSISGKVTLTKETEINGKIWYKVFDDKGWCMGCSRELDEAEALFRTCCENYNKHGGSIYQILRTHP